MNKWIEAHKNDFDLTALGHNYDDHIETVLIQLFRGAGKGIRGIPDLIKGNVIRPLYDVPREYVRMECNMLGLPYFDDPVNDDLSKTRNMFRAKIIPALREHYGSGFNKRIDKIAKLSELMNE